MGLMELLFQVETPDWPVAEFTRRHPATRVIMNHTRYDEDHFPVRNVFTVLIESPEQGKEILEIFQQLYADVTILRQDGNTLSALVEPSQENMKFFKGPFTKALRALGQDRILRPITIRNGWLTIGIVTAAKVEISDVIKSATDSFRKADMNMKMVRWGDYRPEDQPFAEYEEKLTAKQVEIVKMGLALGFYDNPRRCTLDDLARVFGISKAAAHNRLKSAERKVLESYFA